MTNCGLYRPYRIHRWRKAYIIAPQRMAVGDKIIAGEKADIKPGNASDVKIHACGNDYSQYRNETGQGAQMLSAGTYAQLVGRDQGYAQNCLWRASHCSIRLYGKVGAVSNPDHMNQNFAKQAVNAGRVFAQPSVAWP